MQTSARRISAENSQSSYPGNWDGVPLQSSSPTPQHSQPQLSARGISRQFWPLINCIEAIAEETNRTKVLRADVALRLLARVGYNKQRAFGGHTNFKSYAAEAQAAGIIGLQAKRGTTTCRLLV